MSRVGLCSAFNKTLHEFLTKVSARFPENSQLCTMKNFFHVGLLRDQECYSRYYHTYAAGYTEHIMAKNEQLFLDMNFSFIPNFDSDEFKELWIALDAPTKKAIWAYLHILTSLSHKIYSHA